MMKLFILFFAALIFNNNLLLANNRLEEEIKKTVSTFYAIGDNGNCYASLISYEVKHQYKNFIEVSFKINTPTKSCSGNEILICTIEYKIIKDKFHENTLECELAPQTRD